MKQNSSIMSKVSVVLAGFNEENTIIRTLESINSQTYKHIEIVYIDDASSDRTLQLVEDLEQENINIIRNSTNIGLTKSLNKGIHMSTGDYICRIDAGDIFASDKIRRQVNFLNDNPEYGIIGTWACFVSADGSQLYTLKTPEQDHMIKQRLSRQTVLIHPTVLIRKLLFDQYGVYDESFTTGQESELWTRFASKTKYYNIPEPLVTCLHTEKSISHQMIKKQLVDSMIIKMRSGLSASTIIFILIRLPVLFLPLKVIGWLRKVRYSIQNA